MTNNETQKPIPGSNEDLAIELVARYGWKFNGVKGRTTKLIKNAFIDGALWMKGRISESKDISIDKNNKTD